MKTDSRRTLKKSDQAVAWAADLTSHQIQPLVFATKLVVLVLLLSIGVTGTVLVTGSAKFGCQILVGLMLAHATEFIHQCLHKTGIGNAKVDRTIGVSLGLPTFVSHSYYQFWHLWHHRWNGTPDDRESFGYAYDLMENDSRLQRLFGFALHLTMLSHFFQAFRRIVGSFSTALQAELVKDHVPAVQATRIVREHQLMGVVTLCVVAIGVIWSPLALLSLWLIPLMIWAPVHALIELPEHMLCNKPNDDTCMNTRSIKAGWFMRWFTNFNCNHIGHHEDMLVPMHKLPAFEAKLCEQRAFVHYEESYAAFYLRFLKYLWVGPQQS